MAVSLDLESGPALVAFLELSLGGGIVRLATAPVDLAWNGQTWQGVGGELSVDPAREAPGDDRASGLRLRLSAVNQAVLAALLQQTYIGRRIRIWYGHVNLAENLVSNSDLETDTAGMGTLGSSLARVTTPALSGLASLKVTTTNVSGSGMTAGDATTGTGRFPVTVGGSYVGRARVQLDAAAGAAKPLRIGMQFFDAGGSSVGHVGIQTFTLQPGETRDVESVPVAAVASSATGRLRVDTNGAQGVFDFYVDRLQACRGQVLSSYVPTDGAPAQGGTIQTDPLLVYVGFLNGGWEVAEDLEQQSCSLSTLITSRLSYLTNRRGIKTNLGSHQRYFLGDLFFQYVPGLAVSEILWGAVAGWVTRWRTSGRTITQATNFGPRRP